MGGPGSYALFFRVGLSVVLPPDLSARIQAQNAAGHVVFTVSSPEGTF